MNDLVLKCADSDAFRCAEQTGKEARARGARSRRSHPARRDGVSQEHVEAAGGLGQNALTRIEGGTVSPSFDTLVGVAAGLGVALSVLIATYERQLDGGSAGRAGR